MDEEQRAQLIEDIQRSAAIRERIVEQARIDKEFDISAAWEELEELDSSIYDRIEDGR